MTSPIAAWAHKAAPASIACEGAMEHLFNVAAFAALIAAQFLGVVFVAAMDPNAGP